MFKEYLGRHKQTALPWDAAGIAGTPFRVKIGDPEPTFHFIAMLTEKGWNHFSIPPDKLQKITADVRVSVAGRSIDISSTTEIKQTILPPRGQKVTNKKFRRLKAAAGEIPITPTGGGGYVTFHLNSVEQIMNL
tara:strand:- start:59 stop:460 length:402 start_codon:yes stop_codon:yes gene_type:complete